MATATKSQPIQPKPRGRRTKYVTETIDKILAAIRIGATYELAARGAGISVATFTRWRERYGDFDDKMREAEGVAAYKWLKQIEQAGDIDWKAAAWKLERRHAKEYGRQPEAQITINLNQEIVRQLADEFGLDPNEVIAEYDKVLRQRKDQVMHA